MENKKEEFEQASDERLLDDLMKNKRRKRARKITLYVCLGILLLLLLLCVGVFCYIRWLSGQFSYDNGESQSFDERADDEAMDMTKPDAPAPPELPPYEIIENWFDGEKIAQDYEDEVLNILLIGADTLDGNSARSDTMILMSVNTVKNRLVFTSFMRDSYIELPGYNYNRLNAAHSKGGPAFLIETLEYNFDIDIDYYAKVDFTSFKEAVDVIGGMTLTVNEVNYNYFYDFEGIEGLSEEQACDGTHTVHLNGEEALMYARTRKGHKVDGGDFGRTLHQRDFLLQFVNSCKGASLGELHSLFKTLFPHIVTDMPQDKIQDCMMNVLTYVSYDTDEARVPCAGSWENYTTSGGAAVLNINVPANEKYVKAIIYG